MKMKTFTAGLIALSMFASSVAMAQPRNQERHQNRSSQHQIYQEHRTVNKPHQRNMQRQQHTVRYESRFRNGQRLPQHYRSHSYRVNNWRSHGLRQSPRGHYWAKVDNDFILIAAATGMITSILLSR